MADLPDFYSFVLAALTKAINLTSGLDAAKEASPTVGDVYVATDTTILYLCYEAGTWVNAGALYLLLAGGTMAGAIAMGGNKITGLGAPTAAGGALRKGTRVTVTELPAMTDEKIWKGTGGNVEEVDIPVTGAQTATGTYTGNGVATRQVTVGFKCALVFFLCVDQPAFNGIIMPGQAQAMDDAAVFSAGTAIHASDGFVVADGTPDFSNEDTYVYYYCAISE